MNKAELIDTMSEKSGLTKTEVKNALEAFIETAISTLKEGDKISLVGFGTFSISERAARTGRNPQTGEKINIAAKKTVKFKAGSELAGSVQ
jgi:DNA-binding protein HU-beta